MTTSWWQESAHGEPNEHRPRRFGRLDAFGSLGSTNQDAVGVEEIFNGGTFRQEFWIGQDLKLQSLIIGFEDTRNGLSGADRDGTLLHNNLVATGNLGNFASTKCGNELWLSVNQNARASKE